MKAEKARYCFIRYANRITLHIITGQGYDPTTGKNTVTVDSGTVLPCNLSPISAERTQAIFGDYNKHVTVARLQRNYNDDVDVALIDNKKYNVLKHVPYAKESVLYLEGVTEWS